MKLVTRSGSKGFTLIELLVVIAIIALLGAITFAAIPTVLLKAKVAKVRATFNQVNTSLTTYMVDNQSYPPGYGYKRFTDAAWDNNRPDFSSYYLNPFYQTMRIYDSELYIDPFSRSHDTSLNGDKMDLLEYSPVGVPIPGGGLTIPEFRFLPGGGNAADVLADLARQQNKQRPFVYIPVNSEQFDKVNKFYFQGGVGSIGDRMFARIWGDNSTRLGSMQFPPAQYDRFVLISVGPLEDAGKILCDPLGSEDPRDVYHITGLRSYFLATRDANADNRLDYDYDQRRQGFGANAAGYANIDPGDTAQLYTLPDGTNGAGPMIYDGGK